MKIVIAAWHLANPHVGLGRYARGLIEGLSHIDDGNDYLVVAPCAAPWFPSRPHLRFRRIRLPLFRRRLWEQTVPNVLGEYDILHLPYDGCAARHPGRLVVTIHDVKPLLFPELAKKRGLTQAIENWWIGDRRARIDHVVTDSEHSRRDIVRHCGFAEDRISVVFPGVDLDRFGLQSHGQGPARPYVLSVAGADPTKNLESLIAAFGRLPRAIRDRYDLVLVGDIPRRPAVRDALEAATLGEQIRFLGPQSDDRLITLYQEAALFVFPSRYEGFGLPVLEAMACGCPVISSNAASLPEVAGDAAILVDATDVAALAGEIERTLTDEARRQELRTRGVRQAGRFTWERTAREISAVYRRVLSGI